MAQKTGCKNWRQLLGIGALVLAFLFAISGSSAKEIANLQGDLENYETSRKITVFYWGVLFGYHGGTPLMAIILLIICVQIYEAEHETNLRNIFAGIALSVLALAIVALTNFSQLFSSYEHVTSKDFDGYRYNLGLSKDYPFPFSLDGGSFYVIGKCDLVGIGCNCYAVSRVNYSTDLDYEDQPSRILRLERDAKTKIIYIKTQSRNIPISR
jgi:hypothetical protein